MMHRHGRYSVGMGRLGWVAQARSRPAMALLCRPSAGHWRWISAASSAWRRARLSSKTKGLMDDVMDVAPAAGLQIIPVFQASLRCTECGAGLGNNSPEIV